MTWRSILAMGLTSAWLWVGIGAAHAAPASFAAQVGRMAWDMVAAASAGPLSASMSDEARPGSGPEAVQFEETRRLRNRFLLGGLLVWSGLIFGGLLYFSRRKISGLVLAGVGVVAGALLMASEMGWLGV